MTDAPDGGPANRPGRGDPLVQVEQLSTDVTDLRSDLSELAADVVRADALAGVATEVERLGTRIEALADEIAVAPDAGPPVTDWDALSSGDAQKAWNKLWRWLTEHYIPRWEPTRFEVPDCWTRHPAMRDSLSVLRDTWLAGRQPGAMVATAAQWDTMWHRHYLQQVAGLAERFGCAPGMCRGTETGLSRPDEDSHRDPERYIRPEAHWLTDGISNDVAARQDATDPHAEPDD